MNPTALTRLFERHCRQWRFWLRDLRSGEALELGTRWLYPIDSCFRAAAFEGYNGAQFGWGRRLAFRDPPELRGAVEWIKEAHVPRTGADRSGAPVEVEGAQQCCGPAGAALECWPVSGARQAVVLPGETGSR